MKKLEGIKNITGEHDMKLTNVTLDDLMEVVIKCGGVTMKFGDDKEAIQNMLSDAQNKRNACYEKTKEILVDSDLDSSISSEECVSAQEQNSDVDDSHASNKNEPIARADIKFTIDNHNKYAKPVKPIKRKSNKPFKDNWFKKLCRYIFFGSK